MKENLYEARVKLSDDYVNKITMGVLDKFRMKALELKYNELANKNEQLKEENEELKNTISTLLNEIETEPDVFIICNDKKPLSIDSMIKKITVT